MTMQMQCFPDPTPILEQAIVWKTQAEKTNIAVEEANHLRAQIALVQTELADLKNQGELGDELRTSWIREFVWDFGCRCHYSSTS